MLTIAEKNALRFYIGDVSGDDPFWGDPKAYVLLNALFFPGIAAEVDRAAEGKYLNPAILADIPRLLGFFSDLLPAFRKCTVDRNTTVYRVERLSDYQLCRQCGSTLSLTSTSTAGFLDNYRDRRGIALMRFELERGVPCINAAEVLDEYAKPEEAEILLPPFLELEFHDAKLSAGERRITDCDGAPPKVSVVAIPKKISKSTSDECELSEEGALAGQRVCRALNEDCVPDPVDTELYSHWKINFKKIVSRMI